MILKNRHNVRNAVTNLGTQTIGSRPMRLSSRSRTAAISTTATFDQIVAHLQQDVAPQVIAQTRWEKFRSLNSTYRKKLYGTPNRVLHTRLGNFLRFPMDILLDIRESTGRWDPPSIAVQILQREAMLTSPGWRRLITDPANAAAMQALLEYEVFREINCEYLMVIRGLTIEQLNILVRRLGGQPRPFLSGPRNEDTRFVFNHHEAEHPLLSLTDLLPDKDTHEYASVEQATTFYQQDTKLWRFGRSRTHAVVYFARDHANEPLLILSVHVDPKTPLLFIEEKVRRLLRKQPRDTLPRLRGTVHYHRSPTAKNYVGTGLTALGTLYFLHRLQEGLQKGLIASLVVSGEKELEAGTSKSILGDERVSALVEDLELGRL